MTTPNENVNVIVAIKDTLNQVGFACPTVWEATTLQGAVMTLRFRFGHLSLVLNEDTLYSKSISDDMDGCIDWDRAMSLLAKENIFIVLEDVKWNGSD
jgi:3-deoxy-D-arabino-heptulosonate 7-phosphate (DAHP) synthase